MYGSTFPTFFDNVITLIKHPHRSYKNVRWGCCYEKEMRIAL